MIEYITLSDLVKKVSQDAVEKGKEIFNTKKIREKYINIFEMMNIDNNKSRREYEKRMGMITDEERLRVKEFIEQLEAQRKKPQ